MERNRTCLDRYYDFRIVNATARLNDYAEGMTTLDKLASEGVVGVLS